MNRFRAYRIHSEGGKVAARFEELTLEDLAPGEVVIRVSHCGLSETHDGGYAQFARVAGDWVIPMPQGLDAATAMAIGTAGFTAALAIHRMEQNGQQPGGGPIAVTGASGGVGSVAIDMLSSRGYRVVAVSGTRDARPRRSSATPGSGSSRSGA